MPIQWGARRRVPLRSGETLRGALSQGLEDVAGKPVQASVPRTPFAGILGVRRAGEALVRHMSLDMSKFRKGLESIRNPGSLVRGIQSKGAARTLERRVGSRDYEPANEGTFKPHIERGISRLEEKVLARQEAIRRARRKT